MGGKSKRRRLNSNRRKGLGKEVEDIFKAEPLTVASEHEKKAWRGWCELESDPALFNVMLREFGVKGVKCQEVWSMDDSCLDFLPRPIYGLIFLFRWIEEEDGDEKEVEDEEPDEDETDSVWFANQVADNSCGSVALLNVLNNSDNVELGERLQQFKVSTADMDPHARGVALAEFEHVRAIHNSFARKMDMLVSDLALKDATAKSKKGSKVVEQEEQPGFHFIAFVPAKGKVWKFDGFDEQPENLGDIGGFDWLELARPALQSRMWAYETSQLEFNILSVVRDANADLPTELASNVKALNLVWDAFEAGNSGTPSESTLPKRADFPFLDSVVWTVSTEYGVDNNMVETAESSEALSLQIAQCTCRADFSALLDHLASSQFSIRGSIVEERRSRSSEEDLAARRQHDYGPAVFRWLQMLHKKGELGSMLAEA